MVIPLQHKLTLAQIRENERNSHKEIYSTEALYSGDSWLKKPVKTVTDLFPYFEAHTSLRVLDLGCGVGRNCIAIAQQFQDIPCRIDCVDILDFAIETLQDNARKFGVSESIHGITCALEAYPIPENTYDLILAVSALEHVDSESSFRRKMAEIKDGVRKSGMVCLIINSGVREYDKQTGEAVDAQFEVNLPTESLQALLSEIFAGWEIVKSTVREQRYDIPRGARICDLHSNVVTYVAKNG